MIMRNPILRLLNHFGYTLIKCSDMEEERENARLERDQLRQERDAGRQERDAARHELAQQVEKIREERESLFWERDQLRQERDVVRHELAQQVEKIKEERESLFWERDQLRQERDSLQKELKSSKEDQENLLHDQFGAALRTPEKAARFVNTIVQGVLQKQHRSVFWGDRLLTLDKTAGFLEDPGFLNPYQQIKESHIYDQYSGPDGVAWRLNTLVWAAKCALHLPGDFVECGVFKGDFSWVIATSVDFANIDKTLYLYDTFAGFSPKYSSPDDFPLNPNFLQFAQEVYAIPDLFRKVKERFQSVPNVKVIQGVLPEVLEETAPDRIAFMHIDLNSPAAEVGTLEVLFDRIVPGGMVVFDDYGWLEYVKQKRAEDAFADQRGYSILELPTGQGVLVKRQESSQNNSLTDTRKQM